MKLEPGLSIRAKPASAPLQGEGVFRLLDYLGWKFNRLSPWQKMGKACEGAEGDCASMRHSNPPNPFSKEGNTSQAQM